MITNEWSGFSSTFAEFLRFRVFHFYISFFHFTQRSLDRFHVLFLLLATLFFTFSHMFYFFLNSWQEEEGELKWQAFPFLSPFHFLYSLPCIWYISCYPQKQNCTSAVTVSFYYFIWFTNAFPHYYRLLLQLMILSFCIRSELMKMRTMQVTETLPRDNWAHVQYASFFLYNRYTIWINFIFHNLFSFIWMHLQYFYRIISKNQLTT